MDFLDTYNGESLGDIILEQTRKLPLNKNR